MDQLYSHWRGNSDHDKDGDNRLLKKLRLALLFWFLSFIMTAIWFTYSPAF